MNRAYIALGSNINPRDEYLEAGIKELQHHPEVSITKRSRIYETAPVGYTEQNDFLNMVIQVKTSLPALNLLDLCQSIEHELGRKRMIKWGPRTIDLDILMYNQEHIDTERLKIPHPSMHERAFVMVPLAELDPEAYIPAVDTTAQAVLNTLPNQEIEGVIPWQKNNSDWGSD
ncbi:2-amino-4-hydroxy-6-hydroxymethyldihydropteridine diphosphokinase [Thalassobacillus hwangdonensis]|uniref:2-amino-4-hydroxy-6-hydroxymethyldihydropteridine diphosphokinase n=1 Tax=Thalassobacillus hwangdonensis TaxID=546108 RepID=A0ABW3L6M8_9BACI